MREAGGRQLVGKIRLETVIERSTEEGNAITEDDQKRKLELVVKTAEAIWGGV